MLPDVGRARGTESVELPRVAPALVVDQRLGPVVPDVRVVAFEHGNECVGALLARGGSLPALRDQAPHVAALVLKEGEVAVGVVGSVGERLLRMVQVALLPHRRDHRLSHSSVVGGQEHGRPLLHPRRDG